MEAGVIAAAVVVDIAEAEVEAVDSAVEALEVADVMTQADMSQNLHTVRTTAVSLTTHHHRTSTTAVTAAADRATAVTGGVRTVVVIMVSTGIVAMAPAEEVAVVAAAGDASITAEVNVKTRMVSRRAE